MNESFFIVFPTRLKFFTDVHSFLINVDLRKLFEEGVETRCIMHEACEVQTFLEKYMCRKYQRDNPVNIASRNKRAAQTYGRKKNEMAEECGKYVPHEHILIIYVPSVCSFRVYGSVHFSHAFVHFATFRRYLFFRKA